MKTQRIHGQTWDPKSEKSMFTKPAFLYTGQKLTQRKVLSLAVFLLIEIGLIAPFAIRIRWMYKKIKKRMRLLECYQQELQEWLEDSDSVTPIQFSRCLVPNINRTYQIHTFTDALLSAFAAIVYLRTGNA